MFKFFPEKFVKLLMGVLIYSTSTNKKAPQKTEGLVYLVEAGRIELPSASTPPSALHAYPILKFNQQLPNRQGKLLAILDRF